MTLGDFLTLWREFYNYPKDDHKKLAFACKYFIFPGNIILTITKPFPIALDIVCPMYYEVNEFKVLNKWEAKTNGDAAIRLPLPFSPLPLKLTPVTPLKIAVRLLSYLVLVSFSNCTTGTLYSCLFFTVNNSTTSIYRTFICVSLCIGKYPQWWVFGFGHKHSHKTIK